MDKLTFIVEQAEKGGYNARAETESIFTQADTLQQLYLNIADAIECHFDDVILPGFTLKFVELS
jgi:predicted RNase H-like HicB family nuclease